MKLSEMVYQRPNIKEYYKFIEEACYNFKKAQDADSQISIWEEIINKKDEIECMQTLMSIRNSINSNDEFYKQEKEFWISESGNLSKVTDDLASAFLETPYRSALESKYGTLIFSILEQARKTFSPEIMEDLILENKLSDEFNQLRSNAQIHFKGQIYTISEMDKYMSSKDEEERHTAIKVVSDFYKNNTEEYDRIYDELVKVRHKMARKLGYDNFIQLAYDRFGRLDFTPQDVAKYREQIQKYIVPMASELLKRQAKRNGKDKLLFLDESLSFKTGNPTPKGNEEELVSVAKEMYKELSKETEEFFNMMCEEELLDLPSRKGKQPGGYCTFIPYYKKPFIFANFNGTAHDVDVLTHEAGHAFQVYCSRNLPLPEYRWATLEASEIHSMSMEFFAWPWMENFFKEDTDKYYFKHLSFAVLFLPYGALVDHFQEQVFLHPEWSKEERKKCFRDLEKIYLPLRDYEGVEFFNEGTYWYKQGHIFEAPFYYIDYTLAQVCALQYWVRDHQNHSEAWSSYLKLCKLGGSKTFLSLLEASDLKNPFDEATFPYVFEEVKKYLDRVDDSKF